ncbi:MULTISPECIES: dipeptidase PepE [Idiomarinaceae]|uniref:Dipeptidase PepE n=1 Tax=Pseudidiomarina fusca TaxID=2965078 RepID=A0ABU3KTV8_9GAMM|nr:MULTISPECIES: dipeptidase PepE [Idiomarinaceae]MDT7524895.1 dipeptidase PepE [Pseudidiomarina sp. GXY010]MRJ40903.1 dipeptidase PepE [Idiomarina sp. FeN1]NCU56707.1 dipeptidase PepE [Idiomarina sp. FenA--70]NCU59087.1 dipeptidase PepE [Idiomarina sp. FenBw--71]UUN14422.1 dipeptidase PepE [Idiomarina loihiensis]
MANHSKLLLMSSSKAGQTDYLEHSKAWLREHFASASKVLFIPYAGVGLGDTAYTAKVAAALADLPFTLEGIESFSHPQQAVYEASAIMIGGGNTFQLLNRLYQHDLLKLIANKVAAGMPYAGWSAGANIAGLTIRTTNDMPIIEPPSFKALQLVPFQLNPHYSDYQAPGFHGETRDQRLAEFMLVDPATPVLAIKEGTALKVTGDTMQLLGPHPGYAFLAGDKLELAANSDCSNWLVAK